MTGRAWDGDAEWDGPEWAAPERAERIATNPRRGRAPLDRFDFALYALIHKMATAAEYFEYRQVEARLARANRARGIPKGERE